MYERRQSGPALGGPCLATRMRCQHFSSFQNLVYRPNLAGHKHIRTTDNGHYTWYIWRGTVFRVPVSTLQRPKQMGGWEMPDIEAKFTALLLYRMYLQGHRNGRVTAALLQIWNLTDRQANLPHATKLPTKLAYLYVYAVNMAYITPPEQDEALRCFRVWSSLRTMALALKAARDVRIMTQHPTTLRSKVWGNLHAVWSSRNLKQPGLWLFMISYRPTTD